MDDLASTSQNHYFSYLIVRPEKGGFLDVFRYWALADIASGAKFLESSDKGLVGAAAEDHRWVIAVSVIARKIIALFGKPLEWTGYFLDFFLNFLSLNGYLFGLLNSVLHGKVVLPQRGTETFLSTIGQLDGRIDLYKGEEGLVEEIIDERSSLRGEMSNRALMDLCIMASKLAYENAHVVKNVVNHHWKMHFVDFFDSWNDFQKQRSTQVFILSDKPTDANLILISFRGTEPFDADDWCTDFDYSWYEIPNVGKIHMGFLEALGLGNRANVVSFQKNLIQLKTASRATSLKIVPEMVEMSAYYDVTYKLKSLLEEHKNSRFVVTGHSLGGALAILFPTVLVVQDEMEVMKRLLGVYTFGQPRVGNGLLGRFMEAHLNSGPFPKYFRVVYCNDLVPRLPCDDKTFLYKHFGKCLYFNNEYMEENICEEPNRNYFGIRYVLGMHVNAVWELIRSLLIGFIEGPEYKEGWLLILVRVMGLALPGISAHCPTDYVNSVRLGKEQSTK